MRLSQEPLDVLLVMRHMHCIERHCRTRYRGQDCLNQEDNRDDLPRPRNHWNVAGPRKHPTKPDDTESQENGVELYYDSSGFA